MKTLEITLRLIRKTLEQAPVIVLSIVFVLGLFIVPTAVSYTTIRMELHSIEDAAKAYGYNTKDGWKEDWDSQYSIFHDKTRRERFNELNSKMNSLIATSKVAELCDEYGTSETKGVRNLVLVAIGVSWVLSGSWIVGYAYSEISYYKRMYQKHKSNGAIKYRYKSSRAR